jgi:3-oxoacyl-[acyl-carrier protein] reductase
VEEFQRVFETNLVWNFMIVRQAAIRMKEQHKGSIVFVSSNTAYRAIPNRAAYCASKGGINAMSKAFAVDLGQYGIRSNVVLPGTIKTDRWVSMGNKQIVNGSLTPIGDISDFEDIANAVWYFGTDASKNVTGSELIVDGGMSCQLYPQLLNELKRKAMEEQE